MPDPTPAEIEAGAAALHSDALTSDTWSRARRGLAEIVLRAVLPDHDARIRAEVAEAVAQAIEAEIADEPHDGYDMHQNGIRRAAAIARAHATPPEETNHAD